MKSVVVLKAATAPMTVDHRVYSIGQLKVMNHGGTFNANDRMFIGNLTILKNP